MPPVDPEDPGTEIVLEPEQPELGNDEGQDENIVVELEQPGVGGGELPQTSGSDLLLFGLGLVVTAGGFLIRRRSKQE
ncbi:MAG: LPXTG cell wall anchor domain-containing protein [Firmicutes bacterium]|nr:LPXTG cell wall anchor domain-containing protein [Bacillota bacterium]MCL5993055.1 LPXTG cell wall anchor domain-containing protein [Bacillota bacterium]